ncbi:MAG: SGNH/GDSL hydrolase family protein [Saprospiraceae bacterium]|nr:SGNH/GDSL hydrolase family protein [Saprospiraceae bacterium]
MDRRKFTKQSMITSLGFSVMSGSPLGQQTEPNILDSITEEEIRAFLKGKLYSREEVDAYFAGTAFPFSKHSSEFGWLLRDAYFKDGVNNAISVYHYEKPDGERLMSNYADKPCRINTYGNSFTQCHQVSDHETWQEVLAANLQEPVKNFGVGGWSVYQAYLRMLKEERRTPSEYIIFNIYSDDHYRNLDAWRNFRINKHVRFIEPPLPFLKVDLKNKTITEHANPTPEQADFYRLCDIDSTYDLFKDDFVAKILIAHNKSEERNEKLHYREIQALTKTHGIQTSLDSLETMSQVVYAYHRECALFSTEKIIDKIEQFAIEHHKKVLFILSYPAEYIARAHKENKRWDQRIIDLIESKNLPLVDLATKHLEEYQQFNVELGEYLERYFIGHYNPLGNMFCAREVIGPLVDMLQPRPVPYNADTKLGSL